MVSGEKYNQLEYLESSVEAFWGRRGILAQPAFYYVFFFARRSMQFGLPTQRATQRASGRQIDDMRVDIYSDRLISKFTFPYTDVG